MKIYPILFVFATLILCQVALAQSESQRIAGQIAPLVSENVAMVAHIDLDRLTAAKIEAFLQPFLTSEYHSEQDNALTRAFFATARFEAVRDQFLSRGVREVYILSIPALFPANPVIAAFPMPEMDEEERQKMAEEVESMNGQHLVRNFMILTPGHSLSEASLGILNAPASPRPELLAAFEALEGADARAVIMLPDYARRLLVENFDTLPEPFASLPVPVLVDGMRFVALGFDADKEQLDLVIQARNEQAALALRAALENVVDVWLDASYMNVEVRELLHRLQDANVNAADFLKSLLPQPDGNRLTLQINQAFMQEQAGKFPIFPPATFILQASHQRVCTTNLRMIVLAFHNYHDIHTRFPAAWTVDEDGNPLHSWRVAILPYIEQSALYQKIRLDEPWDSEYNRQFHALCPPVFQCPRVVAGNPDIQRLGLTTYSIIVGPNAWPEGDQRYTLPMITDGTSNTWAVVERQQPVNWMDPTAELTQEEAEKGVNRTTTGIAAPHPGPERHFTNVAFFDGSIRNLTENLSLNTVRNLVGRNTGRAVALEYD